jgi:hypothetical protein
MLAVFPGIVIYTEGMNATLGHPLELRTELIPRGELIRAIESKLGVRLTHEDRHHLAGEPVHCGDKLELLRDGRWVYGRYEWSGEPASLPTFHLDGATLRLDSACLLRWPGEKEIARSRSARSHRA